MRRSSFLLLLAAGLLGGRADDEATRLRYLKRAMKLLHDQCEGKVPLTPYSQTTLPCAGRDLVDGALGKLLVSDGADTEGCMEWLKKPGAGPPSSFGGQPWPAIWYTFGERFNESSRAWLFDMMNKTVAATVVNSTNTSTQSAAGNVGTDVSYNNMYYMNMVSRCALFIPLLCSV